MNGIFVRTLITALGLGLATVTLPGVSIGEPVTLLVAALLLGLVNAFVRPLLVLLTLPLTLVTLGFFLLVINAAMFGLVAAMLNGFHVAGFFSAVFGALIVGLTGTLASLYIGPSGRYEVMVVERRSD
jgi:putative membrane protein